MPVDTHRYYIPQPETPKPTYSARDLEVAERQTVIEMNDEKKAAEEYLQVAAMLTKLGLTGDAALTRQIAADEQRHRTVLGVVLNNIRHKKQEAQRR